MYSMNKDRQGKLLSEILPEKSASALQSFMDKNTGFNTYIKNNEGDLVQFHAIPIEMEGVSWWVSVEVHRRNLLMPLPK